jgi:coproporphyrinogen III oxidase
MKATLEFNLPEDHIEFEMAVNGSKMHSILWEMDQWLRQQYKYMPDSEYSEDKYNTFEKCRDHLREIMIENGLNFD